MSTKIYYGFRSKTKALDTACTWLRLGMWRNIVKLAAPTTSTYEDVRQFVELHGEAGFHLWHDPRTDSVLYALFGTHSFCKFRTQLPPWLKEYSYWDNSDPPKSIDPKKWEERGAHWTRVALRANRFEERLTQIVLDDGMGLHFLAAECLARYRTPSTTLLSSRRLPSTLPRIRPRKRSARG